MKLFLAYYETSADELKGTLRNPNTCKPDTIGFYKTDVSLALIGLMNNEVGEELEVWRNEGKRVSDGDYQEFLTTPRPTPKQTPQHKPSEEVDSTVVEDQGGAKDEGVVNMEAEPGEEEGGLGDTPPSLATIIPSGLGEQWSPQYVALPQFLQLCELFLGDTMDRSDMGCGNGRGYWVWLEYRPIFAAIMLGPQIPFRPCTIVKSI